MVGKIRLAVFASGGGSNAAVLSEKFKSQPSIEIALFVTNNSQSGVVSLGEKSGIPCEVLTNAQCNEGNLLLRILKNHQIDFIILAGYLRKVPDELIHYFKDKIINIHPSLLPKHGGKGMYGMRVHHAVSEAGDKETGCTVHLVNEEYDKGLILAQYVTEVNADMTPEEIATAVLKLEHQYFAFVIEKYVLSEK